MPMRSLDIDQLLPEAVVPVLYERWKDEWPTPLVLSGGTKSITCELVKEVGFQELSKVYGVQRAKLFMDAANQEQHPYG
jgi:hypothetical protein